MNPWYYQYVGVPYNLHGNSVQEGFNCWSFVTYALNKYYGRVLKYEPTPNDIQSYKECARWLVQGIKKEKENGLVERENVSDGDLVVMGKGSRYTHIGLAVDNLHVIHCQNTVSGGQVTIWPFSRVKKEYSKVKVLHVVSD